MGRRKGDRQFNLRLNDPLLKRLRAAAKAERRSINSEMLVRLEGFRPLGEAAQKVCADVRDVMREKQKLLRPLK